MATHCSSFRRLVQTPAHQPHSPCQQWLLGLACCCKDKQYTSGHGKHPLKGLRDSHTHHKGLDRGEVWSYGAQKEAESSCGGDEGMGQQHKNPCSVSQYQSTAILKMRISETTAKQTPQVVFVPVCIPPAKSNNLNPAGKNVV